MSVDRKPTLRQAAPRPSRYVVDNPRLATWVDAVADVSVLLLVAPAGAGKTTAMVSLHDALRAGGAQTVWIHLTRAESRFERFCTTVAAACGGVSSASASSLFAPADLVDLALRDALFDAVAGLGAPSALFLDDFEHVDDPRVLDAMQELVEHLAPGCCLVLGSRTEPALKLRKWKAEGRLLEIGAGALNFDFERARTLLNQRHHVGVDDATVRQLVERTEGWATGLQLAALALGDGVDRKRFVEHLSRGVRDISAYLYEEVFEQQSVDVQDFLVRTSLLVGMTAPLCDAVTGRSDSAPLLRLLEQNNLFVVRIGDAGEQYRYHALFADFLRARLEETMPREVAALQLSAARWHAANGQTDLAIAAALAGGDDALAASLLESEAWPRIASGQLDTVAGWLSALGAHCLDARPALLAAQGWLHVFQHRFDAAIDVAHRLQQLPHAAAVDEVRVLEPMSLALLDRVDDCARLLDAEFVGVELRGLSGAILHNVRAYVALWSGRLDLAVAETERSAAWFMRERAPYGLAYAYGIRGNALLAMGRTRDAVSVLQRAYDEMMAERVTAQTCGWMIAGYLAEALYESGEFERASNLVEQHYARIADSGVADVLIVAHRVLARRHALAGQHGAAAKVIAAGLDIGRRLGLARIEAAMQLESEFDALCAFDAAPGSVLPLPLAPTWSGFTGHLVPSNDAETPEVMRLRCMIRRGEARGAASELVGRVAEARACGRRRLQLKLQLLLVQALAATDRRGDALDESAEALVLQHETALLASAQEEGAELVALLARVAASGPAVAEAGAAAVADAVLSDRELEVAQCMIKGMSNRAIAKRLFISEATVKFHLRNINQKLGTSNRTEAAFICQERGWLGD